MSTNRRSQQQNIKYYLPKNDRFSNGWKMLKIWQRIDKIKKGIRDIPLDTKRPNGIMKRPALEYETIRFNETTKPLVAKRPDWV